MTVCAQREGQPCTRPGAAPGVEKEVGEADVGRSVRREKGQVCTRPGAAGGVEKRVGQVDVARSLGKSTELWELQLSKQHGKVCDVLLLDFR